jgi:hypothetical protein
VTDRVWQRAFDDRSSYPAAERWSHCMTRQPTSLGYRKRKPSDPEWQAAIEALMLMVELGDPTMFARIGVMKALNRGHVREFNPSRKEPTGDRRKLARDR